MEIDIKLKLLSSLFRSLADQVDCGNTNLNEDEAIALIETISKVTNKEKLYNRTQAAKYLHCSVQTFDLYRKSGKIPKGKKEAGGVLQWTKAQLDEFVSKNKLE